MPKSTKSSASSATRKKQAAKAAKKAGEGSSEAGQPLPSGSTAAAQQKKTLQRGQKKEKGKKGEPKKKVYIPPVKPKGDVIDPLDSMGLASLLPAELVLLLRKASKKDITTRIRALEGMLRWIDDGTSDDGQGEQSEADRQSALILALPSWSHLFPRLAVSPNRRLRQLTVQISAKLMEDETIFEELLAQPALIESMLGPLLVIAHGADRLVSRTALSLFVTRSTWADDEAKKIALKEYSSTLIDHLASILFHSTTQLNLDDDVHHRLALNGESTATSGTSTPLGVAREAKNREDVNVEEDTEGTDGRLVAGALGGLAWIVQSHPPSDVLESLIPIITHPITWTSLDPTHNAEERSLGSLSPSVRIAGWNLLRTVTTEWSDGIDKIQSLVGPLAVTCAFTESDVLVTQSVRESLVRLLRARSPIWTMGHNVVDGHDDGEDDDGAESESEEEDLNQDGMSNSDARFHLYAAFTDFLRHSVNAIPSSYTMIILLLATMPDEVLPPNAESSQEVLQALYAPVDEGTLEGRDLQRAFFSAFLECLVWLSGRVASRKSAEEAVKVVDGIQMLWSDYIDVAPLSDDHGSSARSSQLQGVGDERFVSGLGTCLRKLGGVRLELAQHILLMCRSTFDKSLSQHEIRCGLVCRILAESTGGDDQASSAFTEAVNELVRDVTFTTANVVASGDAICQGVSTLTLLIENFSTALQTDDCLSALYLAVESLLKSRPTVLSSDDAAAFFVSSIFLEEAEEQRRKQWEDLLESTVLDGSSLDWSMLRAISRIVEQKGLPVSDTYSDRLEDAFVRSFKSNASGASRLIASSTSIIRAQTSERILVDAIKDLSSSSGLTIFEEWLKADLARVDKVMCSPELVTVVPQIFRAAVFEHDRRASSIWNVLQRHSASIAVAKEVLGSEVLELHQSLDAILSATKALEPRLSLADVVPSRSVLEQRMASACAARFDCPVLSIGDELVGLVESSNEQRAQFDGSGLTCTARAAIVQLVALENGEAEKDVAALPCLVDLAIAATDACLEGRGGRAFFSESVAESVVNDYMSRSIAVATSIFSSKAADLDETWFTTLTKVLQGKIEQADSLHKVFEGVWNRPDSSRAMARLLRGCLNFSAAGQAEASILLRLGQGAERERPEQARAVYSSTKELAVDSPLHERLRNQTAAELAGVKSSHASEKGLELLRTLVVLAPPMDSFVSLVPQQRCIFLMQTLQAWFASDAELTSELYIRLAQVFLHILPIVQDMPGNHLDLIIDVIEMNLDDVDLTNDFGLVSAYHTLVLLDTLIGLAERSAALREVWKDRQKDVLQTFRRFVLSLTTAVVKRTDARLGQSSRHSNIWMNVEEATIDILRIVPPKLFKDDFSSFVQLLQASTHSSLHVMAYRLLAQNIRENVRELVVESAVGQQKQAADETRMIEEPLREPKKLTLPEELVSALAQAEDVGEMGLLFSWLATFEYFEESSLELRAAYTTQLQARHLIDGKLLPMLLARLSPTNDPGKWALDEIFLDGVDEKGSGSLSHANTIDVLTIHVFYRALIHTPNLVCDAFFAIKDRQQSMSLRALTVRHLTPLLAQREFGHLREKEVLDRLQDENMQIKVLANVNEVHATYTVDEYPLEIAISMPNDYPLHPVEVRDIRKIGISEGTWRAWILGMRQLIAGRNGLIVDALLLFKRNVEAKFFGFDEDSTCAICYSIVSPTDHSLPTKPCKTCKKKFHASCLYKWVSTSGSSTCPLCRSIL